MSSLKSLDRLDHVLDSLEQALDCLDLTLQTHTNIIEVFESRRTWKKKTEKKLIPDEGLWRDFLLGLIERFGSNIFTSSEFPEQQKHYLGVLSKDYEALTVVETVGRRKFYRINPKVPKMLGEDSQDSQDFQGVAEMVGGF